MVKGIEHISDTFGAGSSPAGSVGRDLNLQQLHYQYLTTSVAVVNNIIVLSGTITEETNKINFISEVSISE